MNWDSFFRGDIAPLELDQDKCCLVQPKVKFGGMQVKSFARNESPFGPFPSAVNAMTQSIRSLNEYGDGSASCLRRVLSERYGVDKECISIGNGSNELLALLFDISLERGDNIVCSWPSSLAYPALAQMSGATCTKVDLKDDGSFDLIGMVNVVTDTTKILVVCNPNNPTGAAVTPHNLDVFMGRLPQDTLVVFDEAYIEYVDDATAHSALKYFDGKRPIAVLRTFSIIYALAGVRCGYAFVPAPVCQVLDKVRDAFNVNAVAQQGAIASLHDANELERRRIYTKEKREELSAVLTELGLSFYPSQANFVFVRTQRAHEIYERLKEQGILVADFSKIEGLRISIGSPKDMNALYKALKEAVK